MAKKLVNVVLKAGVLSFFMTSVIALQCLDSSSVFVDWYMTYKSPKMHGFSSLLEKGLAHYYLDVKSTSWNLASGSINDTNKNAIFNTLQQMYASKSKDILYIMYNDERPKRNKNFEGGHTKGVVAFDQLSGFWLIHSVPKFPPPKTDSYSYPENGQRYGQSFFCISLPFEMLGIVAKQLFYNEPHIYDYQVPSSMSSQFPVLNSVIQRKHPIRPPYYNMEILQTTKGQKLISFAKTTKYGRDIYTDLVAPKLKSSLLVETWMDGGGQLATNCSVEYKIYNVYRVNLPGNVLFKRSKDHSKWATSMATGNWTCVGDINRMYTQYKRGGGTVCLQNYGVWKTFRQSVQKFEKCNRED